MSTSTNTTVGSRVVTAFFDTAGAAGKAVDDLVADGIPNQHISRTGGTTAEAGTATEGDHHGFWDSLKDFFLPDQDRHSYAEGLRRGGTLLSVNVDEANYHRVLAILDRDGAVEMDGRETEWRSEGWTGAVGGRDPLLSRDVAPAGLATGTTLSAGATALAVPLDNASATAGAYGSTRYDTTDTADTNWRSDETARAAALDGSVPATALAARDDSHGRSRLRSYVLDRTSTEPGEARPGSFSATTDAVKITEHMPVISRDGQNIGTVDHLDGPDRIKLAKNTSPDGQHHTVPFTWIDHVDTHVHLNRTLAEIKAQR